MAPRLSGAGRSATNRQTANVVAGQRPKAGTNFEDILAQFSTSSDAAQAQVGLLASNQWRLLECMPAAVALSVKPPQLLSEARTTPCANASGRT